MEVCLQTAWMLTQQVTDMRPIDTDVNPASNGCVLFGYLQDLEFPWRSGPRKGRVVVLVAGFDQRKDCNAALVCVHLEEKT